MVSLGVAMLVASAAIAPGPQCAMASLPGLSRQYTATIRQQSAGTAAGATADLARLAQGIFGVVPDVGPMVGVEWATRSDLPCDGGVRSRDRLASQMAMVGYSAKEIADVLEGHLSRADLDQARRQLMAGHSPAVVADFLDARWREPEALPATAAMVAASRVTAHTVQPAVATQLDGWILSLAGEHRVPPALVRAMVAAESGGNHRAVSSAGAIGLMQLMPATAAALGVDPWQPRENLRGGITYIGGLLRDYDGDARLALIAYNAGPQHANRVRAGSAVAYRETRRYLDAVAARYPLP